jgi:exodeoxyribonuclease III
MKIISWNVNGLRAVMKKDFPQWIEKMDADILCIQETKLQPDQVTEDMLALYPYSEFHSAERKGYSSVATFSKIKPDAVIPRMTPFWNDNEGRVLRSDYGKLSIFNIYFPNGAQSAERLAFKLKFYDAALDYFESLRQEGRSLIIGGDYNTAHFPIDLARPEENEEISGFLPIERAWLDKLVEYGYIDSFRHFYPDVPERYTWWSYRTRARERNIGWRIDYFFVTPELLNRVQKAEILDEVPGSDHCPVLIETDFPLL